MLRTRKKDINLKPNRILDKKSSRGMLYENEELRLRTIHINDEVDKGHNNIKKLKKENEQLKREIWYLRDECEKLERMLKKVYKAIEEKGLYESLGLPPDVQLPNLESPTTRRSRRALRRESGNPEVIEDDAGESRRDSADSSISIERLHQSMSQSESEILQPETETIPASLNEVVPSSPSPPIEPPLIEITPAPCTTRSAESSEHQDDGTIEVLSPRILEETLQERRRFGHKYVKEKLKLLDFSACSKSVPNLSIVYEDQDTFCNKFNTTPRISNKVTSCEWEPNVLIGYIETGNGVSGKSSYKLDDFKVEELIDKLDSELGPEGLIQVKSVRLIVSHGPGTLFVAFKTSDAFQPLAEKGIMSLRNGDIRIKLLDASKNWSAVHLFSIPPQIPDADVIRLLNQYGQVVAPVERSCYKGVDISERLVKMYLCRKVPQVLSIGGYQCPAKISFQGYLLSSPMASPTPVITSGRDDKTSPVFKFNPTDKVSKVLRNRADTMPVSFPTVKRS